jgi:dihydroxyacetone kinase
VSQDQREAGIPVKEEAQELAVKGVKLGSEGEQIVKATLEKMTSTLISMEAKMNELDSGCGDGDCGSTLTAGAKAIQAAMPKLSPGHLLAWMHELASLAENMGGSSGGIYSILLISAGRAFQDQVGGEVEPDAWVRALKYGLEDVVRYDGAAPGDRTMIGALHPALQAGDLQFHRSMLHQGLVLL